MPILERWQYDDPMKAAMRVEAGNCKGCKHEKVEIWFGEKLRRCAIEKKYGKRCGKYVERGVNESIG